MVFIGKIFGHGQVETVAGHALVVLFYFVILPFLYLVNDSDVKNRITDGSWFRAMKGVFNRSNHRVLPK